MTREAPEKRCATLDPATFESTHPSDHNTARKVCATCPALAWCTVQLEAQLEAHLASVYGGGTRGTWAGRFFGKREPKRRAS